MAKVASIQADRRRERVIKSNENSSNNKSVDSSKGFGTKVHVEAPDYEEKLKKAAQKKKYKDLVQIAKKTPQLVKVVGKGVDAKTPKQNNFPGSSPRK